MLSVIITNVQLENWNYIYDLTVMLSGLQTLTKGFPHRHHRYITTAVGEYLCSGEILLLVYLIIIDSSTPLAWELSNYSFLLANKSQSYPLNLFCKLIISSFVRCMM